MTVTWTSNLNIGDSVNIGELQMHVTGVWFDDTEASPNIELTWFVNGDVKTKWIREKQLRGLAE